jgi:hypothetical protein
MPGIPAWLRHAGPHGDGFTFPDLVFPSFLLMAGMSIPPAFRRRMDGSLRMLLPVIVRRTAGLRAAGVMMVNESRYAPGLAFLPRDVHYLLFYVAIILLWKTGPGLAWRAWAGAALMALLMLAFRGTPDGKFPSVWLGHAWWGILGLIGWSYACCSLMYLAARGNGTALMGAFAFMIALYMGGEHGVLGFVPQWLGEPVGIGQLFGSISANVLAGTLVGRLFADESASLTPWQRATAIGVFTAGLVLAGLLLRPCHPINKFQATETFTLVCAGIGLAGFLLFHVMADLLQRRSLVAFLVPAGGNALFAYILPDLCNQAWTMLAWPYLAQGGAAGIVNAALVALLMLWLTACASRFGLRLKF